MRWGFVLEQESCIGCHACTVGCKAENDVALGSFRTWVKWIETGQFPETERHAAILRCNHCEDAPCMKICPTSALHKIEGGIVDLDADSCIGCASCLQACPYDAIHIDPREGTAAKCHFCAHRLEVDLAPACVAVCPEQAIKVVDLDDPEIQRELAERKATVRKPERGTKPSVFYTGAHPATLDPHAVDGTRTLSHAEVPNPMPGPGVKQATTVYDIPKPRPWGNRIAAYMVTKAIASGALIAASIIADPLLGWASIAFTVITLLLLIGDLHQPSRFFFLLIKPNTESWLVKGGWILSAHMVLSLPYAFGLFHPLLALLAIPVAIGTSVYTAFLFRQARGREMWCEDPMLPWVLFAQAGAATSLCGWFVGEWSFVFIAAYVVVMLISLFVSGGTKAAEFAHEQMVKHPVFGIGMALALVSILFPPAMVLAFACLDWIYIKAGQEVPIS